MRASSVASCTDPPVRLHIRRATAPDLTGLQRIENDADRLFAAALDTSGWAPSPSGAERAARPGFILVASKAAGTEALGFAHVLRVVGGHHLEQLSVDPAHARQGVGRTLVEASKRETRLAGSSALTLRTFADVPWNAPFYRTCGFVECDADTDFLRSLVAAERTAGLARSPERVFMRAPLGARMPS
ncbi:hypothetical protein AX769_15890 [Frondihabitans sp. PAMC 28766]|uniref:GNAT family N-acetyltransferase n=1 Tax=Frondihabitans sp. PAMC 28766 TaxID=1795630 RepID=UPI00078EC7CE|nr:GNAT family N-acetyltransferase [Frondihabitans sp. PAMC 28766]AMM21338.1 hypothetical protein AX769_15890 [Frondihabitans sp. PAMC 28766]